MRFTVTAFCICICISYTSFAQNINYKEWKKEAKENIRLLPKYGNKPKTKEQLAADNQLIEDYIKQEGSRSKASEVLIEIGFNYLYKGDIRTAMYRFNQAWLLDPENENVFWGWGAIYFTFNDISKALEQYDEGLNKNPENSNILTDKGTIFMSKYHESKDPTSLSSAISLFSKSYSIDSLNQNTSYKLSVAHFLAKDCDNALRFYDICEKLGGKPIQKEYSAALHSTCKLPTSAQVKQEIFFADVTIYVEGGKYYLTGSIGGTGRPQGFAFLESTDLKTWAVPAEAKDSLGMILTKGDHTFGTKGFWAPQIFKDKGAYYITYTADEQTALAESESLLGPYRQKEVGPIDGSEKNIDSYIFKDTDDKYYLYSVRFNKGNYLYVAEFDMKTGKINPQTLKRCFDQTEPWEATPNYESAPIMEGPTVIKLKNKYYMFYSANHFQNIDYAIGYAVADSPYGPWVKYKNNPIVHRSIVGENGSGHGDLFEGLDKQLYYVYHIHNASDKVSPRRTRIVPVVKEWDEKAGVYTFSVKGKEVIVPVLAIQH